MNTGCKIEQINYHEFHELIRITRIKKIIRNKIRVNSWQIRVIRGFIFMT
jgi:hypothetical protein